MVFKSQFEDIKPSSEFQDSLSAYFYHQLDVFKQRTLITDLESGRVWTGQQIKSASTELARHLIESVGLKPNDDCVFLYKHSDTIHLVALAVLFAGGSVCAGAPSDPKHEHVYMIQLMRPTVVFATRLLYEELCSIRRDGPFIFKIVIMDDNHPDWKPEPNVKTNGHLVFGLHTDLMAPSSDKQSRALKLPILVDPDRPAFVLLTSGSTGRPKPVARSHRNSIYVCHSFNGEAGRRLWHLDEQSIMAGHLQLDHGTGTFCLKMTLAKGFNLIVMDGYDFNTMVNAIDRYKITDCLLGSGLLHNFINASELREIPGKVSSLRNLIAVGSPIASHQLACEFMRAHPGVSIRQAFGMTECGFMTVVERNKASEDNQTVGLLLPNLIIKLINRETNEEINEPDKEGELLVAGPTVTRGYMGDQFADQSERAFMKDGFYRSNDICSLTANGRLRIRGRFSEVLCLHDGWKVLPKEIESIIMEHPQVADAAVIGIPHPEWPTCHAPRAYVVLNSQSNGDKNGPTEKDIFDFVASHLSEPKHLVGGVKIMDKLPRISVGKVDKVQLRRLDGYLN